MKFGKRVRQYLARRAHMILTGEPATSSEGRARDLISRRLTAAQKELLAAVASQKVLPVDGRKGRTRLELVAYGLIAESTWGEPQFHLTPRGAWTLNRVQLRSRAAGSET